METRYVDIAEIFVYGRNLPNEYILNAYKLHYNASRDYLKNPEEWKVRISRLEKKPHWAKGAQLKFEQEAAKEIQLKLRDT